jgi:hypothetical protein
MNKKEFYRVQGLLEAGCTPSLETVNQLFNFAVDLLDLIEQSTEDIDADLYGTEGWEHAIGWD